MASNLAKKDQEDLFVVVSVEKSEAPQGADGKNWYRYVIERGKSQIVGNMRGSLKKVQTEVDEYVENLNQRNSLPKGRSQWAPTNGQQKKPQNKT